MGSWPVVLLLLALLAAATPLAAVALLLLLIRLRRTCSPARSVAFFHPYAECGGGGERVLYLCVMAIQKMNPDLPIIIYSGASDKSGDDIIADAQRRFQIGQFPKRQSITFVSLRLRFLLEPWMYPRFTLLGQSLGSMIVTIEALLQTVPAIFIDTTGFAFSYPLAHAAGCEVMCYTHYPTVSTDMISVVESGKVAFNNSKSVATMSSLRRIKVLYYRLFAQIYGWAGRYSSLIFVNSTWTYSHIRDLWGVAERTHILFPPCATQHLQEFPVESERESLVLSLGQFRPEKNHQLQLRSFKLFIENQAFDRKQNNKRARGVRLVMVGGCRNAEDHKRVEDLQRLAKDLKINDLVEFKVNISFKDLQSYLKKASLGLHTMWNEHFGMCVVEFMAAGVIPIAHESGGPFHDIVVPDESGATGFLATTPGDYAKCISEAFSLSSDASISMRKRARARACRFSDAAFLDGFQKEFKSLLLRVRSFRLAETDHAPLA